MFYLKGQGHENTFCFVIAVKFSKFNVHNSHILSRKTQIMKRSMPHKLSKSINDVHSILASRPSLLIKIYLDKFAREISVFHERKINSMTISLTLMDHYVSFYSDNYVHQTDLFSQMKFGFMMLQNYINIPKFSWIYVSLP